MGRKRGGSSISKFSLAGKTVLGFDETNNGFHLKCFNPYHKSPMIVTGYLSSEGFSKNYAGSMYERKEKTFNGERDIQRAIKRARGFLFENPDFFYTSISSDLKKFYPIPFLQANAIALLTFKFILSYDLDLNNTVIMMDEISGRETSQLVNDNLEEWFKKAGLTIPHAWRRYGEDSVLAIRKADRVGYHIAALHLLGNNPKWPYRNHKVPFNNLEFLLERVLNKEHETIPEL